MYIVVCLSTDAHSTTHTLCVHTLFIRILNFSLRRNILRSFDLQPRYSYSVLKFSVNSRMYYFTILVEIFNLHSQRVVDLHHTCAGEPGGGGAGGL